jgi:hypothetical protein
LNINSKFGKKVRERSSGKTVYAISHRLRPKCEAACYAIIRTGCFTKSGTACSTFNLATGCGLVVSAYQLTQALPDNLKSSLPSIEEIEAEFSGDLD